jgi:hypothetical protein
MGAPPPTGTFPTRIRRVVRRENKRFPAVGQPLDDVVEDDEHDEEGEDHEARLHPDLPRLRAEILPAQGLDGQDEDLAAVQNGDGEQVEDPELEADDGDPAEERQQAHPHGGIGEIRDLQRPPS